jgi:methyl-accepting chemotaxis protein
METSSLAMLDARQGGRPAPPALVERALSSFAQLREAALERVVSANEVTERAVLATAECLREVVACASHHVEHLESLRAHIRRDATSSEEDADAQDGLEGIARRQVELLSRYERDMRALVELQADATRESLESLEVIARAAEEIERLTTASRVLAINAQIEASRFGEAGKAFAVVASEMRTMAKEIEHANQLVGETARGLRERLPKMAHTVGRMRERSTTFSEEVGDMVGEVSRGAESLERTIDEVTSTGRDTLGAVLRETRGALSHLQFQDPVAQQLLMIDTEGHRLELELALASGIDRRIRPPAATTLSGDARIDTQNHGEVLLF